MILDFFKKFKYKTKYTYIQTINWTISGDPVKNPEDIYFYLMENGFGKRKYQIHATGYSKIYKTFEKYEGPAKIWKTGGDLNTVRSCFDLHNEENND